MTTQINGKPQRKQLSDQLDRFDTLLDGLAEGLNDAIADAVRDGTRLALKDAVIEIMTDPTLRARLQEATAPPPPPLVPAKTSTWSRLRNFVATAVSAVAKTGAAVVRKAVTAAGAITSAIRNPLRLVHAIRGLKDLLIIGAGAGIAIAAVSFVAPHTVSALLSGLSGGVAVMSIKASRWTRQAFSLA